MSDARDDIEEKVTRVTLSPHADLPAAPGLKRHSIVSASDRARIEAALRRLDKKTATTRDDMEAFGALLRPVFQEIDRRATASYVEVGRWLCRVKYRTPHGLFGDLFQDGRNPVPLPIPMSRKKAEALMRVAMHPVLSNPKHADRLPLQSWRTLDELARAGREGYDIAAWLDAGQVFPEMTRPHVLALRQHSRPRVSDDDGTTTCDGLLRKLRACWERYPAQRGAIRAACAELLDETDHTAEGDDEEAP